MNRPRPTRTQESPQPSLQIYKNDRREGRICDDASANGLNFVIEKGLHSHGFAFGGETYIVSIVIADLLFVAFATWR
jgi:hypothetical protein